MSGIQVILPNADFSTKNLGIVGKAGAYFQNGGITDIDTQKAVARFFRDFAEMGLAPKFDYARLFFNNATSDRLNIVNPSINTAAYMGEFIADGAASHNVNGYKGVPGGAYIKSNYVIPAGALSNIHIHAFTTEAETNNNSYLFAQILDPASAAGSNLSLQLAKTGAGAIKAGFERYSTFDSYLTGNGQPTGLVSLVATGGTTKIYDNGAPLNSEAQTSVPFVSGNQPMVNELRSDSSVAISLVQARTFFTGIGRGVWTDANESALNGILLQLRTDLAA